MPRSNGEPPTVGATTPDHGSVGGFFRDVFEVAVKDLRLEWRSREIVYTTALLAVLLAVIFSFAFAREGQPMPGVAGGLLWVSVAFSGTLALGRVYQRERDTMTALLLAPTNRAAIYLGKLIGILVFMSLTVALVVPLLVAFFDLQVHALGVFVALVAGGVLGFAAVGSLFASTLMRSGSREVLLGILTYPIVTPALVAGAKGTAALMAIEPNMTAALIWLKLLLVFDLLFVVLSLWVFDPLVSAD